MGRRLTVSSDTAPLNTPKRQNDTTPTSAPLWKAVPEVLA